MKRNNKLALIAFSYRTGLHPGTGAESLGIW
jgi:hypothetical protein